MNISTTRFGELEVLQADILNFPEGILGFESLKKFFIVDPGDHTFILWLQSSQDGGLAFPVIEPKIFQPQYIAKLLPMEMASLKLDDLDSAKIFSILTIPQNLSEMTANLKAPLVINTQEKIGKQIVLQDNKLSVKFEMYLELKKYIVGYQSSDKKRTQVRPPATMILDDKKVSNDKEKDISKNSPGVEH